MRYRLLVSLVLATLLGGFTLCVLPGCATTATRQEQAYHTLKAVALAGQAAIDAAAILRTEGKMSPQRWQAVARHYDGTFQPALRLAIEASAGDHLAAPPPSLLGTLATLQALAANK